MDKVSKFNPHHDEFGRFTFARSANDGGGTPKTRTKKPKVKAKPRATGKKKQDAEIDARTDAVVKELGKQIGEERAENWRPMVRESLRVWLNPNGKSGDTGKQLVINGKKLFIGAEEKPLTAQMVLDMVADSIGTSKLTGISEADFASGDAFRRLAKFNPHHDEFGRFTFARSAGDGSGTPTSPKRPANLKRKERKKTIKQRLAEIDEEYASLERMVSGPAKSKKSDELAEKHKQIMADVRAREQKRAEREAKRNAKLPKPKPEKKRKKKKSIFSEDRIFRSPADIARAGRAAQQDTEVEKYNPHHDSLGRFASAAASATMSFLRLPKLAVTGGLPRNKPKPITEKKRKYLRGIDAAKTRRFKLKRGEYAYERFKEGYTGKPTVSKANEYHDEQGRFTSAGNAVAPKGGRKKAPSRMHSTMQKKGGFTYDARKNQLKRKGMAVSIDKSAEEVTTVSDFEKNGVAKIKDFLAKHRERLAQARQHLGGWIESGKAYLDISTIVKTVEEAADLARKHDQIAFFDLGSFTTWTRYKTASGGYKYLASGIQTSGKRPIVGDVPIVNPDVFGKAEQVEGVIFCDVASLLDDQSIQNFVEQVLATAKISKNEPTSSDVHLPTIMNGKKRRTKKLKKSEVVAKKEKLKDPKGGLTAAGRRHFNRTTGSNLKPGVRGKADTPEKMRRKGSFLTRFFTNPSGPMKDEKGRPTRLALSAAAWGEPVPSDRAAAARLAQKGRNLLDRYENTKKKKKVSKFNPHHDELGRFTSGSGGGLMDAYVSDYERRMGRNAKKRAANEQKKIQRRIEQEKRKETKAKEEARRTKIRIQQKNKKLKLRRRKRR